MSRALWLAALLVASAAIRIVYGAHEPHIRRFWDEQYALMNVRSILEEKTLEPAKSYYPSPVFNLPAAALVAGADHLNESIRQAPELVYENGKFGPEAFLLLRWLQALYGVLAVALTFRLGRRLISPTAGWLAATLVAFSPWAIHASGYFKPDSLLLVTVLVAFDLAVSAVRKPQFWRFVLAGFGIALAMSAKLTGALIAVSLIVGCCWAGEDLRKRFGGLVVSGGATLAFFFLLNPYGQHYLLFLSGLKDDYKLRTDIAEGDWLSVLGQAIAFPLDPTAFGPLFGLLALIGYAALVLRATTALGTQAAGSGRRRELAMMTIYPPVFAFVYASQTAYFKPNNFLGVLPFLALGLGWLIDRLGHLARARFGAARWAYVAIFSALLAAFSAPGLRYVYQSLIPMTYDAALGLLERPLRPKAGRTILVEQDAKATWIEWESRPQTVLNGLIAIRTVDSLADLPSAQIAAADALVFTRKRARRDSPYREWATAAPGQTIEVKPNAFALRGPSLLLVNQGWRPQKPRLDAPMVPCNRKGTCWQLETMPQVELGATVSLYLHIVTSKVPGYHLPEVTADNRSIPVHLATTYDPLGPRWVTERFSWPNEPVIIKLEYPSRQQTPPRVVVVRWQAKNGAG